MTKLAISLALSLALLLWLQGHPSVKAASSHIRLNSQFRYEDILMSAENDAYFTTSNIQKLTEFLEAFSTVLSIATEHIGRKMSVQSVRLIVPIDKVEALRAAGYTVAKATWESANNADIRLINSADPSEIATIPADECYGPNNFIRMPSVMARKGGNANQLLRQFTKLRWGALDETNSTNAFYQTSDGFKPSICTENTPGQYFASKDNFVTQTGPGDINVCLNMLNFAGDTSPAKMEQVCRFNPTQLNLNVQASIMAQPAALYCDNSPGTLTSHNRYAINQHNTRCNSKSVAEVLRSHPDFSSSTTGTSTSDIVPTLTLIEPKGLRQIVLVLDLSGSMSGNRVKNMIRAATLYVKYIIETGADVSIVVFNETARVVQPMMEVTGDAVRQNLVSVIQALIAMGFTNISGAIALAMQILGATPPYSKSQTGWVLLITDGEHNTGPSLDDAIANAAMTGIVFDTICISALADSRMANLSDLTGGRSMFSSQNDPVNTELETNLASLADRSVNLSMSSPVLLRSSVVSLPMYAFPVTVDSSVKKSLVVVLSLPGVSLSTVNFTVQSPADNVYGSEMGPSVYQTDSVISTITIVIPNADIVPGTWQMNAFISGPTGRRKRETDLEDPLMRDKRSTDTTGSVVVFGDTAGSSSPISIDAWLRYPSFSQVTSSTVQKIYAYITIGSAPLTNATVEATVVPATGAAITVSLKDDGLGSDMTANDGTYVALILPERMTSVGDYGVTVVMSSPANQVISAGKFRVEALATGPVTVPPGRVTDLAVSSSIKNQSVLIQFTSPGNQAYEGIPAGYEVRASNSFDQVSLTFDTAPVVARLSGQPVGAKVQATLWASNFTGLDTNSTFYLAVVTLSTTGLRGQPSFPTGALLTYPNGYYPTAPTTIVTVAGGTFSPPFSPVASPGSVQTTVSEKTTQVSGGTSRPLPQASSPWTSGMVAGVAVMTTVLLGELLAIVMVALFK